MSIWNREKALANLGVTEVFWDATHEAAIAGADGWSAWDHQLGHVISLAPSANDGVTLHELAHIILGHTHPSKQVYYSHQDRLERLATQEVEAETTALLAARELNFTERQISPQESFQYIESYASSGHAYPNRAAVMEAVKVIVQAGQE